MSANAGSGQPFDRGNLSGKPSASRHHRTRATYPATVRRVPLPMIPATVRRLSAIPANIERSHHRTPRRLSVYRQGFRNRGEHRTPEAGDRPAPVASRPAGFSAPVSGQGFRRTSNAATVCRKRPPVPANVSGQGFRRTSNAATVGRKRPACQQRRKRATVRPCAACQSIRQAAPPDSPPSNAPPEVCRACQRFDRGNRSRPVSDSGNRSTVANAGTRASRGNRSTVATYPARQAVANIERAAGSGQPSASPAPVASRPRRIRRASQRFDRAGSVRAFCKMFVKLFTSRSQVAPQPFDRAAKENAAPISERGATYPASRGNRSPCCLVKSQSRFPCVPSPL